jgi:adenylate cyclase
VERRLTAILAADVVDYSRLMGEDQERTLDALRQLRTEHFNPVVGRHSGNVIKSMGDGWIVEFPSISDAVNCAIQIQLSLTGHEIVQLRIGIHTGEVTFEAEDVFGDGVNVAARLEALAEPGQVLVSDNAHQSLDSKSAGQFVGGEMHDLKNIKRSVAVWRWAAGRDSHTPSTKVALTPPDKPSIAVLPFNNNSGDPEQEYFSDGISEDIITEISRISEIMVISRNSTFTYKGRAVKVQEVCRDLGVRYVLEGSVRKAGDRVRINAQLIDGQSGGHLWAERYDRVLADIFSVQDDVTEKIVQALKAELIGDLFVPKTRAQNLNLEAYECVLRGREQYRLFTKDGNDAAQELFERAIVLDPDYAEPYAGLAETCVQNWFMGSEPNLDRAFEFAGQAADRDPELPLVYEALSTVYLFRREHDSAIAAARSWIALEPNNADAYATLAGAMHFSGENNDVMTLIEKAMRLNPFYPFFYPHYIGMANLIMRRFEAASVALKRAIVRNPDALWPHVYLAACHGYLQDESEISQQSAEIYRISPDFSIAKLGHLLPYKNQSDIDLFADGLSRAGMVD